MGTITKRLTGMPDHNFWDGTIADKTFTADTSTGRTMTLRTLGYRPEYDWVAQFGDIYVKSPWVDVRAFDASGSASSTTGSISTGTYQLTLAAIEDFRNGQGVCVAGAGAAGADLIATIESGEGGLVLTLDTAAGTTVVGAAVTHDDTTAIQAAIDSGASTILLPAGVYSISALSFAEHGQILVGVGSDRVGTTKEGTWITYTATTGDIITVAKRGCLISNLSIHGPGLAGSENAIHLDTGENEVYNVYIENVFCGIKDTTYGSSIRNVSIYDCVEAVYAESGASLYIYNSVLAPDVTQSAANQIGLRVYQKNEIGLYGVQIDGADYGIKITSSRAGDTTRRCRSLNAFDLHMEYVDTNYLYSDCGGSSTPWNNARFNVYGGKWTCDPDVTFTKLIVLDTKDTLALHGLSIEFPSGTGSYDYLIDDSGASANTRVLITNMIELDRDKLLSDSIAGLVDMDQIDINQTRTTTNGLRVDTHFRWNEDYEDMGVANTTFEPDLDTANVFSISANDNTALTISNPVNGYTGQMFVINVRNNAGAAMGEITWGANYRFNAGTDPAEPANTKWVCCTFIMRSTNFVEIARTEEVD